MATTYRSYAQFVLLLVIIAALLMGPGYFVSRRLGGADGIIAMFWGCGLSFLASAVGGLPLLIGSRSPRETGVLQLSSLAIRMGVTLLGVLAIVLGTEVSRKPFLLWVAFSYLIFLIVDVGFVLLENRSD